MFNVNRKMMENEYTSLESNGFGGLFSDKPVDSCRLPFRYPGSCYSDRTFQITLKHASLYDIISSEYYHKPQS